MVYNFINIIDGEYYQLIESLDLRWHNYSLFYGGRDIILFIDSTYYYRNSNTKEVYTIDDIKRIIEKNGSTSYRNPILKKLTLDNYNLILDTLKKYERQKKLTLILN